MSRPLVSPAVTTTSASSTLDQLESELANEFSRRIGSYSDVLLLRHALRQGQSQFHQGPIYSYLPTASTFDWGSVTALSVNTIQDSFRAILEAALERCAPISSVQDHDFDYLYDDEGPSEIISSGLAKVRVSTENDIELPWA